jgi:class 3 adenylate cyclase
MVGSTDMTQDRGDKAAQHLVRRHNTIVRNALAQHAGKEIKHTGDGIMASFSSAASGVEAAISIQRTIAKHNAQNPNQDLHIRVGINAGEPIEEEEDLFGTTVQLAARVCARCETDQILCSNVVKELASGRGLAFESLGAQELKGFKEQVVLYQVGWRE